MIRVIFIPSAASSCNNLGRLIAIKHPVSWTQSVRWNLNYNIRYTRYYNYTVAAAVATASTACILHLCDVCVCVCVVCTSARMHARTHVRPVDT